METAPPPTLAERDFPLGEPGFTYQDLHREDRLADLDAAFLEGLSREDAALADRLRLYRAHPEGLDPLSLSRLLVDAARPLGQFLARLFGIEAEWRRQAASAGPEAVLFRFRRDFLQRRAVRTKLPEDLASLDTAPLSAAACAIETLFPDLPWTEDPELATSRMVVTLLDLESDFQPLFARRRPRKFRPPRGRPPVRSPAGPPPRPIRSCRAPPATPTPTFWRFSSESWSATPSGATHAVSTRPCAATSEPGSPSVCPRLSTTRTWWRPSAPTPRFPRSVSDRRKGTGAARASA